jgi:PIN domain nuclease of toxin-antitoxin system
MVMKYAVDTHALIWFLEGNPRIGTNAKIILSESTSQLILPAIVLAEAAWIVERGRTSIPSVMDLLNAVETDARVSIYPVDKTVVKQSVSLTTIGEMHDRQIVATTLVLASQNEIVALLTCDRNITASGLVKIIW